MHIQPVILCGGSGTRLWPLSRFGFAKQFLSLTGDASLFQLACPASPIHYQIDPVQTTKTSVHGAINMLGLAKRVKAMLFQASTSEVYGDPSQHPQTESYWGNVNP